MKNLLVVICGLGLLMPSGLAQTSDRADAETVQELKLPTDARVRAKLMTPLNAAKARPGDLVTAEVVEDVEVNGNIIVPRKARLQGHVTEAQPRSKAHSEARLGFVFDSVKLTGRSVGFPTVLSALMPYERTVGFRPLVERRDCTMRDINEGNCQAGEGPLRFEPPPDISGFDKFGLRSTGCQDPVITSKSNIKLGWYTELYLTTPTVNGALVILPLRLSSEVHLDGSKPGDEITEMVTSDTLFNGRLVAKGTKLAGRVKVAGQGNPVSLVEIAFDKVISPEGEETTFADLVSEAWPEIGDAGLRFRFSAGDHDTFLLFHDVVPKTQFIGTPELMIAARGDVVVADGTPMALHICRATAN